MKLDFSRKTLFVCLFFLATNIFANPCIIPCAITRPCGFYGGFSLGYTKLNQPSIAISQVPGDVNEVFASVPGATLSGTGFSFTINSVSLNSLAINTFNTSQSNNLAAGNLFVGYKFYQYFALEGGVGRTQNFRNSYTSNINAPISGTGTLTEAGVPTSTTFTGNFANLNRNDTINTSWIYLLAKVILPINQSFELFTKLGYTFLYQQISTQINLENLTDIVIAAGAPPPPPAIFSSPESSFSASRKSNNRKAYPIIGLGGSYFVRCSTTIDVLWTRILVNTSSNNNNVDFYSIGFTTFSTDVN